MARGTPTYFTGTIIGINNVEALQVELETRIKAYQSAAVDAWGEFDVVNAAAGSRDVVFRSLGDRGLVAGAGDAALNVRITQSTAANIKFRGYQDWSTVSSTGTNEASGASASNGTWTTLSATQDMEFFGVSNEYEFVIVLIQGGAYRWAAFGSPKRTHVPTKGNGIALTLNAEVAGAAVVIEVDRDITANITVSPTNQRVWVYNVTPTATALRSGNVNTGALTAKAAGSLTIDNLDNNIEIGAIIGLDPSPMYIQTGTTSLSSLQFTNHATGTYEGISTNTADIEPLTTLMTEAVNDPAGGTALYLGAESILDDTDVVNGGFRGTPELMSFWARGTQADQDRMIPNFDTVEARKVFVSIVIDGYALGIGPGAT